jgi:hypothetical protein
MSNLLKCVFLNTYLCIFLQIIYILIKKRLYNDEISFCRPGSSLASDVGPLAKTKERTNKTKFKVK